MVTTTSRENKTGRFAQRYRVEVSSYLKQDGRTKPISAARLGKQAVSLGLDVLDLTMIHEEALIDHVISMGAVARNRTIRQAGKFFAEAIVPMEETHRTALENNTRLIQLNQALDQRTLDLSASNTKLKSEITKRKSMEQTLRKSELHSATLLNQSKHLQEDFRRLSRRVLSAQEDERKRISRELHDLVAQTLTGINIHLSNLSVEASQHTKNFAKNIASTQKLVEASVDKVHEFARELRPALLDDLGLIPALHSFVESFAKETGLRVHLSVFSRVETLSNAKRTMLYRIFQEALTNAARHAHAKKVTIQIKELEGAVRMQIHDDGRAFNVEQLLHSRKNKRMGLLGMRERAEMIKGTFKIESTPESGTTVTVEVPFPRGVKDRARL